MTGSLFSLVHAIIAASSIMHWIFFRVVSKVAVVRESHKLFLSLTGEFA
jgi:hypothetical protein